MKTNSFPEFLSSYFVLFIRVSSMAQPHLIIIGTCFCDSFNGHIRFYARPHPNLLPRGEGERFHTAQQSGNVVSISAFFNFIQSTENLRHSSSSDGAEWFTLSWG